MKDMMRKVAFQPQGRIVHVLDGTTVLEAAANAGLVLDAPCGGNGTCGKCRFRALQGADDPCVADRATFSPAELEAGWRLACQTAVARDLVVHVPGSSLFGHALQIATASAAGAPAEVLPCVRKAYVALPPPTLEDNDSDLLRLEECLGPFETTLPLLRQLPARLRALAFKGTAVLSHGRLIDFEPGDTADRCFGVAFDIGTTTLVASLLHLPSGEERAVVSRMNPQVAFGDDVLARIRYAGEVSNGLDTLRKVLTDEIGRMVAALADEAGIAARDVFEVAFAGNTTMLHLLCGIDPTHLGVVPFTATYGRGLLLRAHDLEVRIHPAGMAYVFPVVGGFVGGDTAAGMMATRIDSLDGPALLVDIGTNGEIVLAHPSGLLAASTAAGPAFEGARISCGMRAVPGAIEKVVIDTDVHLGVIGDAPPMGICGSGLIDLAAELLRLGIVSSDGRMRQPGELKEHLPERLVRRVQSGPDGQPLFVLSDADDDPPRNSVAITQRDIRELQLGCGAIRAGVAILLRRAGLHVSDLKTVLVAGGFGSFIRPDRAQRIGLLPPEVNPLRLQFVGNVSLAGACHALLSEAARKRVEDLARQTRHVELSTDSHFMDAFAEAMLFPETECGLPGPAGSGGSVPQGEI